MTTPMRHGARRAGSVALAVAVPLLLTGPAVTSSLMTSRAAAAGPVTNGMIATFAWQPGAHNSEELDLVVMKPDGSGAQVLVAAAAQRGSCGFDLDWSPDGNRIAWASNSQVWTIKADGTDRQHLADGCVSHIDWSPDGGTLAVEIAGRTGLLAIAGGAFTWLRSCEHGEGGATFSPDGSKVSTVATADCDNDPIGWGVYGFNVTGGALDARYADTNLRSQPPNNYLDAIPNSSEWHPSQDLILMSMDDGSEGGDCHPLGQTGQWSNSDLFTVPASTDSPLTKLGSTSGEFELWERDASWSPDGQRILFTGDRSLSCQNSSYVHSGVELFTMNANGSGTTKVWTPWNVGLGFVHSSWQPCTATTLTCMPVPQPDTDGDGVPDPGDACPAVAGPVGNNGCPIQPPPDGDADGDGIPDASDACLTVPGPQSNQGCPVSSPTPPSTATPPVTGAPTSLPASVPSRMKGPRVLVRGAKAVVRWSAASANGSVVTKYVVDISKGKDKTVTGSARRAVFKHLAPGRYKFRIAATNAIGTSPFSARVKVRVR